jgi:hypothetical protein
LFTALPPPPPAAVFFSCIGPRRGGRLSAEGRSPYGSGRSAREHHHLAHPRLQRHHPDQQRHPADSLPSEAQKQPGRRRARRRSPPLRSAIARSA